MFVTRLGGLGTSLWALRSCVVEVAGVGREEYGEPSQEGPLWPPGCVLLSSCLPGEFSRNEADPGLSFVKPTRCISSALL
jgi:hypothetical protein